MTAEPAAGAIGELLDRDEIRRCPITPAHGMDRQDDEDFVAHSEAHFHVYGTLVGPAVPPDLFIQGRWSPPAHGPGSA